MKSNQGLIKLLILILIALIVLGYYGISIRNAVQNPTTEDNISYVWNGTVYVWDAYLKAPAGYLWNIFINDIWTPAISNLETQQVTRSVVVVSLGVGANTVNTNLGRKARGCTLCPTVADATFAWSFAVNGDAQATITVLNVAEPNCPLEFY